jgi:S1-C subfamily serine protease
LILRLVLAAVLAAAVAAVLLVGPAPAGAGATAAAPEGREVRAAAGARSGGEVAHAFSPKVGRGRTVAAFPAGKAKAVPAAEPAPAPSPAPTRSAVVKQILPSNVRIAVYANGTQIRSASGVIVAEERAPTGPVAYVLTNTHVVSTREDEHATFEVLVDQKRETSRFAATVAAVGEVPDVDIAVLKVPGLAGAPATLAADDDLELGDEVVAIGAPFGRGLSISSGIVSQLEWDQDADEGPLHFKTDAPIGYGASGGGIYRIPDGKLLALVEGYRTAKVTFPVQKSSYSFDVPMPGETFAAPVAKIRRFLRKNGLARLLAPAPAATADASTP